MQAINFTNIFQTDYWLWWVNKVCLEYSNWVFESKV